MMTKRTLALTAVLAAGFSVLAGAREGFAFDHSHRKWGEVLKRFTEDGFVDYAALQKSGERLETYLEEIESVSARDYASWTKEEKMAFWINAYNVAVLKAVIGRYPLKRSGAKGVFYPEKSIQQIPDVWDEKRITVMGKALSLNDIEHRTLRQEFADPRVHFALVCASLGCPTLRQEPYEAAKLNRQLDGQVREFLAEKSKARYDEESDTLWLSPIFKWFRQDFESAGGILPFLLTAGKHYLPSEMEGKVTPRTKISWLGYDWSLNDTRFGPE